MKTTIIFIIAFFIVVAGQSQVTPFTGGEGSGASHKASPAISCPMFGGGNADGVAANQTPAIACGMFSGGAGDGFDVAQTHCEEMLTMVAGRMGVTTVVPPTENEMTGAVRLYPNPASGSATLQINAPQPISTQLIIYRSDGVVVRSQTLQLNKGVNLVRLDLHAFSSGLYFIHTGIGNSRLKLMVGR